jgi:hypothetical protein
MKKFKQSLMVILIIALVLPIGLFGFTGCDGDNKTTVTIPSLAVTSFVYDGTEKTVALVDGNNELYTVTGDLEKTNAGNYAVIVTLKDTSNYKWGNGSSNAISLAWQIQRATPTITTSPIANGITYGANLLTSTLTGGVASVAGTFAWQAGSTIPTVVNNGYPVRFTPADTVNYNAVTIPNINITVAKATPTIITNPISTVIDQGSSLFTSALTGGVASVAGTFAWENGATVPTISNSGYPVIFTPTDTSNYNTVTIPNIAIVVNATQTQKTNPAVTSIPVASEITYGETLSTSALMGGVASVAGVFTWQNGSNIPNTGNHNFTVIFTPTDTENYNTVIIPNVAVTVAKANQAPLTISDLGIVWNGILGLVTPLTI